MHAKSNAEVAAVRSALELSNVTLLRNARRLSWKRRPMAQWSHRSLAEVGAEREVFRGDIVVVSCGAANTAKPLLMSANDKHPNAEAIGGRQSDR
jgi:hypothetical protein